MSKSMYPTEKEIEVGGTVIKFPGLDENKKFTNGDFNNPLKPASFIPAETINLILDNLNELIEAGKKEDEDVPNNTSTDQIKNAVFELIRIPIDDINDNLMKNIIDISHPVGSYYPQFPNENGEFLPSEEPGVLFKNTIWDLMDYTDADGNGVFFRTEGGLSSEGRVDGVQSWALENIKGIYSDRFYGSGTGAFASIFTSSYSYNYAHSGDRGTYAADFDASRVAKTSTETRGLNMNFRIFRRYM